MRQVLPKRSDDNWTVLQQRQQLFSFLIEVFCSSKGSQSAAPVASIEQQKIYCATGCKIFLNAVTKQAFCYLILTSNKRLDFLKYGSLPVINALVDYQKRSLFTFCSAAHAYQMHLYRLQIKFTSSPLI
jgi:hypothetical protein